MYATVNAHIRICRTLVTWGNWNPALIPGPWSVCNLTLWAAFAPAATPSSFGITQSAVWIDNSACNGGGFHREVFSSILMNDANCYNGGTCCHQDTNLYPFAICQP